jgi:cytochrome c553
MKHALMIATLAALAVTPAAWAGDAAAGKAKAAQVCGACHGPEGNKPSAPDQPILAGQYPDYLIQALHAYKSGTRTNPIMKGFASTLSDKDIEDVAAWFASQSSNLHTPIPPSP